MPVSENELFDLLKKEIAETFRQAYPSCTNAIELWKGQDIINFQEELMMKVKGRISEKWFYTHIKTKAEKLPRIDMLNMLSEYAGYQNWQDFTRKYIPQEILQEPVLQQTIANDPSVSEKKEEQVGSTEEEHKKPEGIVSKSPLKTYIIWTALGFAILISILLLFSKKTKSYQACFTDLNGKPLIANAHVEIRLLKEGESPIIIRTDEKSCVEIKTDKPLLRFLVSSPYYKADTIIRVLENEQTSEQLKLQTNDYALMIHYFSTANLKDWKQRRLQLEDMITRDAKIFQVYVDGKGMELYNKEEFINKLTMPLKSLKNIEIIETHYTNNRISLLRFEQVEK